MTEKCETVQTVYVGYATGHALPLFVCSLCKMATPTYVIKTYGTWSYKYPGKLQMSQTQARVKPNNS